MNYLYINNKLPILNNPILYSSGLESVIKSLEIAKSINEVEEKEFNIFIYWIGDNVNYKHKLVLKSFLATQNLKNAKLKIYSDVDLSKNQIFYEFLNYNCIEFNIFNIEEEIKDTIYENFNYVNEIKLHKFNPAYESDFFRLLMLYKYGGFYIDFDVLLLRDLSPLIKYDFLYQWGYAPLEMLNGAIMHLNKGSESNKLLTQTLLNSVAQPNTLHWASELYIKVKKICEELIIFPSSFFNLEWQLPEIEHEPMKKIKNIEILREGSFTWHWHNRWNETIEINSKFDILDKKINDLLIKKFNYEIIQS